VSDDDKEMDNDDNDENNVVDNIDTDDYEGDYRILEDTSIPTTTQDSIEKQHPVPRSMDIHPSRRLT